LGPRCTLGEASAVSCAEVRELAVVGALTGIGPDVQLPSRSLAIGAPPWRFTWHRQLVKQADPSDLVAPELDADVVLPSELLSELHKALRRRDSVSSVAQVLVTGAAGFLGRYMIHELLRLNVEVHAVLRGKDEASARARLLGALENAGLILDAARMARLHVVNADISQKKLGLDTQQYQTLCSVITGVYHVASRVNHAEPYQSLKRDNVQGTLNMLEFSVTSRLKNFHYVSTIGTITPELADPQGFYPESPALGHIRMGNLVGSCEITGGYAYSKWVAEKLVNLAFGRGLPGSVWRPGIIGGCSRDGHSGEDNFVHLIKDMVALNLAPLVLGSQFNITPVDFVAHALSATVTAPPAMWRGQTLHPIAKGSDLDMPTLHGELTRAGYPLQWTPFHQFRDTVKDKFAQAVNAGTSTNEFKSWLLVGALSSEGLCLDASARNDRAWDLMRSAPGADAWNPPELAQKMIRHLISVGKLPPPPSANLSESNSFAPVREDSHMPLL